MLQRVTIIVENNKKTLQQENKQSVKHYEQMALLLPGFVHYFTAKTQALSRITF